MPDKNCNKDDKWNVCEEGDESHNSAASPPRLRVVLNLGIVKYNPFLQAALANSSCLWYTNEGSYPPDRKEEEP